MASVEENNPLSGMAEGDTEPLSLQRLVLVLLWNLSSSGVAVLSISSVLRKLFGLQLVGLTGGISTGKSTCVEYLKSKMAASRRSSMFVDFDKVGHDIYAPGKSTWTRVIAEFADDAAKLQLAQQQSADGRSAIDESTDQKSSSKLRSSHATDPSPVSSSSSGSSGQSEGRRVLDNCPLLNADQTINRKVLGAIVWNDKKKLAKLVSLTKGPILCEAALRVLYALFVRSTATVFLDNALLIEGGLHRLCDQVLVVFITKEEQIKRLMARDKLSSADEALAKIGKQMAMEQKVKYATTIVDNSGEFEATTKHTLDEWIAKNECHLKVDAKEKIRLRSTRPLPDTLTWKKAFMTPTKLSLIFSTALYSLGFATYKLIDMI